MTMKIEYTCNICQDKFDKDKLYGVRFGGVGNNFHLSAAAPTDIVRICIYCLNDLVQEGKRVLP
jgi:hypothetical protein